MKWTGIVKVFNYKSNKKVLLTFFFVKQLFCVKMPTNNLPSELKVGENRIIWQKYVK